MNRAEIATLIQEVTPQHRPLQPALDWVGKLADVVKKYRTHTDIERELKWMGPMKEVPEKLG